ncbi:MAG: NUDIX domain-containing protein [Opitutaceae bacterium]|jgi:8-oxo-dGTP diphosphatase|nr:NUDIX domain-containing protein [Opitutaceae bacterium]
MRFMAATDAPNSPPQKLGYKIAVLVFIRNSCGQHLLLLRAKAPNLGTWSPIGGKLETAIGESPFECAVRETHEETGHLVTHADLHLFAMIAEKAYEGASHWLLFLFDCTKPLDSLPAAMEEGKFGFFSREQIEQLPLPETDKTALWQIYDRHHKSFVALRADCAPDRPLEVFIEQIIPAAAQPSK